MHVMAATSTKKRQKTASLSLEAVEAAVKKAFPKTMGSMSIKYLWADQGVHRIRVNWLADDKADGSIVQSRFLHLVQDGEEVSIIKEK